jgi:hypothetical protein
LHVVTPVKTYSGGRGKYQVEEERKCRRGEKNAVKIMLEKKIFRYRYCGDFCF